MSDQNQPNQQQGGVSEGQFPRSPQGPGPKTPAQNQSQAINPEPKPPALPSDSEMGPGEALSASGEMVRVKTGYGIKDPSVRVVIGGKEIGQHNLTHSTALLILRKNPAWFRLNVTRASYKETDQYWSKK